MCLSLLQRGLRHQSTLRIITAHAKQNNNIENNNDVGTLDQTTPSASTGCTASPTQCNTSSATEESEGSGYRERPAVYLERGARRKEKLKSYTVGKLPGDKANISHTLIKLQRTERFKTDLPTLSLFLSKVSLSSISSSLTFAPWSNEEVELDFCCTVRLSLPRLSLRASSHMCGR